MFQIPATRPMAKVSLLLLIALGASSCGNDFNLNPNVHPPKTAKKQRLVPCDTTINVNLNTGGVDLDAAFVCETDKVTWVIQKPHTFQVVFKGGSPFDKDKFSEQDATRTVKGEYKKLEAYKYTITVDSMNPVDPQVIGGGNP